MCNEAGTPSEPGDQNVKRILQVDDTSRQPELGQPNLWLLSFSVVCLDRDTL